MRTHAAWRADLPVVSAPTSAITPTMIAGSLSGRRTALASYEAEDAHLTGMTRSLDRRLLALNLGFAAARSTVRKVA